MSAPRGSIFLGAHMFSNFVCIPCPQPSTSRVRLTRCECSFQLSLDVLALRAPEHTFPIGVL